MKISTVFLSGRKRYELGRVVAMIRDSEKRFVKMALVLFDVALIHLGYITAYWLLKGSVAPLHDAQVVTFMSAIACFVLYFFGFYTDLKRKGFSQIIYTNIFSLGIVASLLTLAGIYTPMMFLSLEVVITGCFIHTIFLIGSRFIIWRVIKKIHGMKKVMIFASDENSGVSLANKLLSHRKGWFVVSGLVILNERKRLEDFLEGVDVFLISPSVDEKQRRELVSLCIKHEKEALIVPQFFELFIHGSTSQQVDDRLVLSIPSIKTSRGKRGVKRAFDLIVSFSLLVAISPVMCCLWILIPLTSKGPALFKQERLGMSGKPYQIYKFRSMVRDAEKNTGPVLAVEYDPRITTVGKLLRATRLDELPQLYNVLKGEMSLIGPRPERKYFCDQFQQEFTEYSYRMNVKPGITGLAQVMAKYTTTPEDKLRFDLLYIRHYSFGNDIKILLQTIRILFQREQAEGLKVTAKQDEKKLLQSIGNNQAAGL